MLTVAYRVPMFKEHTSVITLDRGRTIICLIQIHGFTTFYVYFHRHKAFAVSRNIGELGAEKRTSILPGDAPLKIMEEPFQTSQRASGEHLTMVTYSFLLAQLHLPLMCYLYLQFYSCLRYAPSGIHMLISTTARAWQHAKETVLWFSRRSSP